MKPCRHVGVYFVVETLEFLHRGGRIGGAARFIGSALNLKPILELKDGRIEAIDRVRTKSKALDRMLELVGEQVKGKSKIRLSTLQRKCRNGSQGFYSIALAPVSARLKVSLPA